MRLGGAWRSICCSPECSLDGQAPNTENRSLRGRDIKCWWCGTGSLSTERVSWSCVQSHLTNCSVFFFLPLCTIPPSLHPPSWHATVFPLSKFFGLGSSLQSLKSRILPVSATEIPAWCLPAGSGPDSWTVGTAVPTTGKPTFSPRWMGLSFLLECFCCGSGTLHISKA